MNKMKKRFIVLIDFSEYSGNLIKYACDWSKKVNAELILVHQSIVMAPALLEKESKQSIAQHTNEEAMQKLEALAKNLIPSTINVSFLVSDSNLRTIIPELLSEPFENLIFTGIKGTGFLKKIFIGSVALHVIENSNDIVVAIPKEISSFSQGNLFVAVSDKHPLNLLALNKFLNYIDSEKTSITFFYLAKPNEKTTGIENQLSELTGLYADRYKTSYTIYEGSDTFESVKEVIQNVHHEMLIVQKGSRLLVDQLFRRFLINELVYEGRSPLIVLP